MDWLKQNLINIALVVLVLLTVKYLFCASFREQFIVLNIDAGIVTGLVASFALLVSVKQGIDAKKQGARDRNFAYRLSVKSKFEEMGQLVIAKLYSVQARRQACVATLEHIQKCLGSDTEYRDSNGVTSTDAFNSDNGQSTATLDVYFPAQAEKWNEVIDLLNEMGSLAAMAMLNYVENDYGRKITRFLTDIDKHVTHIKELDKKMAEKPKEIRDGVMEEVNKHTLNLTKI